MRVRIQTQAPLPELKAWFVPDALESIFGLKQALCQRVPALSTAQCLPENILLMLDGFELLDDSPFDAVRDGDLIVIKVSPGAEAGKSVQRKRKRDDATPLSVPGWRKTVQTPAKARANFSSSQGDSSSSSSEEEESDSSASSASSSSSSSSSSTSSSSSSSSKSSSSSSSSSSESSSSSASSSPPRPQPSKKKPSTIAPTASSSTEKKNPTYGHVPPGAGKASTHARNRRRRVKREHDKAMANGGVPVVVPNGLSTTNTVPLGERSGDPASIPLPPSPARKKAHVQESAADVEELARAKADALASLESSANGSSASTPTPAPVYASPSEIMMLSLRNKNKKKGFRLSMARPIPQKIVFGDDSSFQAPLEAQDEQEMDGESAGTIQVDGDGTRSGSATPTASQPRPPLTQQTSSYQHARLVPPSDLYAQGLLPSNMLVTSVDVEAGMWDGPSKRQKKKKSKGKKEHADEQWQFMDAEPDGYGYEDGGPMVLDYSEDAGAAAEGGDGDEVDWAKAERAWDSGRPVTDIHAQLAPKSIVGWKALDLNPLTFTPEVLLKLARVVSVDAEQKIVVIRHLERSSSDYNSRAASGFGFGGGDYEDGGEGEHEETRAWADILVDSWRLLDL